MEIKPDYSTEQLILESAEKLFLEKGFALTTTTEIARVAGCNQALVHYYFRSKEKLFAAVFEKNARFFVTSLFQVQDENLPFEEKLKRKIELHFDWLRANPRLPFLFFNELIANPARLASLAQSLKEIPMSVIRPMQAELESEIAKGNIRPITAYDLIISMFSLNVMLFLASPIFRTLADFPDDEFEKFIDHRKKENVLIILRSLKVSLI